MDPTPNSPIALRQTTSGSGEIHHDARAYASRANLATHSIQPAKPTHFNPIALLNPSTRLNVATDRYIFSPLCCLFWNELGGVLLGSCWKMMVCLRPTVGGTAPAYRRTGIDFYQNKNRVRLQFKSRWRRLPTEAEADAAPAVERSMAVNQERKRLIAPRVLPGRPKTQRSTRSPGLKDCSMD